MASVANSSYSTSSASDEVIALYIKDVNRIKLLTRDEERELALKAQNGDKEAKERIVNANLRFVINIAKKYQNHGLELSDLISEGNIGLLTAIDRFEVERGYHFISYAVWWIRQSILKAICEKSRPIRLPLNRANELVQIERARKMVMGEKSDREEIQEIADILGMDKDHVQDIINVSRDMISLDCEVNRNEDGGNAIGDLLEDKRYETPEDSIVSLTMREDIDDVLSTLDEKEAGIIRLRYGLGGAKPLSLKQVGDEFRLTKERIRQIEKKAIKRLQHPYRTVKLEAYVA
ncbi:MAG: RNA polymerase sigma factor RpoD/SigA [Treponemataceae bacterium]|nr:MAG: RNA polymerase sigma factor RpoD/SigA [Treponemataceae bacterium]